MSFIDRMKENGSLASRLSGSELWRTVIDRGICASGGVHPDQWYPVSAPATAARREASDALALCAASSTARPPGTPATPRAEAARPPERPGGC